VGVIWIEQAQNSIEYAAEPLGFSCESLYKLHCCREWASVFQMQFRSRSSAVLYWKAFGESELYFCANLHSTQRHEQLVALGLRFET
jgi:hypothetical protein